ncbi:cyanophycinase [Mesonia aestuariivivens]|uniref:Cyanophycinase n=1 Tax=Mesonia aestuariivivens TaxID=2796128 RepID=A0ABS6VY09_9FLAO|nr:cyanophycinase [Mesonia aestuariivivens]MBW2960456.1 cyanophycinase [Mesonia aestuariivivens]
MSEKGILIIIGGNEDKGMGIETSEQDHLEFIEESILARVVQETGGTESHIVVVPTASRIPEEVAQNYLEAFKKLNCSNISIADIRNREDAEDKKNIHLIEQADCVLFSGGDQSKITHKIGGTKIHQILLERYKNEKFVIAGTSAGAMCMSQEMITGGGGKELFNKGSVSMGQGLGFIPNLTIDSHFIRRGRFGRLAEAVSRFPEYIGVGLAENTGLVVKKCKTFEVIGSGMIILFDASELKYSNQNDIKVGEQMTIVDLKTHVLASGCHFNLDKKRVKIFSSSTDSKPS